jgi:two-component system, OmpR family, sensor histidine kinase SenX3
MTGPEVAPEIALWVASVFVAIGLGVLFGRLGTRGLRARAAAPRPTPFRAALAEQVVAVTGSGVVVLDRDEFVVLANPAARRLGVLDSERGDRLQAPELRELAREVVDSTRTTPRSVTVEFRAGPGQARRGELQALNAVAAPIRLGDDDRPSAVVLLLDDVTESRRLEAVRRDFVANVSHELKTPVGALTLLAEAVLDAADDPEAVARFAQRMQREGTRLGRLVRELIELSRLQGAEPLPGDDIVFVADVLDDAVDAHRLTAEQAGINVLVRCPPSLAVCGNAAQLAMAVSNLLDNAIAYSPPGTRVAVTASTDDGDEDDDGTRIRISVSDQGIGIAPADQQRVFERFYRVDQARSRATGGTGLGLAIVKHVATNHGGTVAVWSREGAGSTFSITLPAASNRVDLDVDDAAGADTHDHDDPRAHHPRGDTVSPSVRTTSTDAVVTP